MKSLKRTLVAVGVLAAFLPFGVASVDAKEVTSPVAVAPMRMATDLDRAIDLVVQQRAKAQALTAAERQVYREQLQLLYLAMPPEVRAEVLAAARNATSDEGVSRLGARILGTAADAARRQVEDARKANQPAVAVDQNAPAAMTQKLGGLDSDLVFVPTAGPCRVADTRLNITANWPGQVAGFTGRQIWGFSNLGGYNYNDFQGGTGIAGSGNCTGTVYGTPYPVSVVATIAVVNTSATGYLRAWNGGTTLTVGGVLGWNAGDVLSNTTVIPMDRTIAEYPGSGPYKRDFAVYNNSGNPVDVIVDVVGYFIVNKATPLDCTRVNGPGYFLPAGTSVLYATPACPTGYTSVVGLPVTNEYGVDAGTVLEDSCRISNYTGTTKSVNCDVQCCRIPGR